MATEIGTISGAARAMTGETPTVIDEWALVLASRKGDRTAFERLYRRHVGRVHALLLRISGSPTEAEELTQEVFVRAWQKLDHFAARGHFPAWLTRVAVNLMLNERRTRARRGTPLEFDETRLAHAVARRGLPSSSVSRLDLEQAIASLPEGARLVFVLCDVHGYRHDEVSAMTGLAVGTTKAQLHRARRRLREVLDR